MSTQYFKLIDGESIQSTDMVLKQYGGMDALIEHRNDSGIATTGRFALRPMTPLEIAEAEGIPHNGPTPELRISCDTAAVQAQLDKALADLQKEKADHTALENEAAALREKLDLTQQKIAVAADLLHTLHAGRTFSREATLSHLIGELYNDLTGLLKQRQARIDDLEKELKRTLDTVRQYRNQKLALEEELRKVGKERDDIESAAASMSCKLDRAGRQSPWIALETFTPETIPAGSVLYGFSQEKRRMMSAVVYTDLHRAFASVSGYTHFTPPPQNSSQEIEYLKTSLQIVEKLIATNHEQSPLSVIKTRLERAIATAEAAA